MALRFSRPRALACAAGLAALAALGAGVCATLAKGDGGPPLALGYTLTHTKDHCPPGADPKAKSGAGPNGRIPSTEPSENVILHYDNPAVRSTTSSAMRAMRGQGAGVLRLMLWYGDARLAQRTDHLGLLEDQDGRIPQKSLNNLADIIRDAESAGYARVYVVIGALGTMSPKCRIQDFGDCFDAASLPASWAIHKQVIDAVRAKGPAHMPVIYDLALESCPGQGVTQTMKDNLGRFTGYMVRSYKTTYGDQNFLVSCTGQGERGAQGVDSMVALYRSLGVKPAALDMHIYSRNAAGAQEGLARGAADAAALGVPLDLMETDYDAEPIFSVIRSMRRGGDLKPLRTVAVWPKTQNAACGFNLTAPYPLDAVRRGLGIG